MLTRDGTTGEWVEEQKLIASDARGGDLFGNRYEPNTSFIALLCFLYELVKLFGISHFHLLCQL